MVLNDQFDQRGATLSELLDLQIRPYEMLVTCTQKVYGVKRGEKLAGNDVVERSQQCITFTPRTQFSHNQ